MKKPDIQGIFFPAFVLFAVCLTSALLLALTNTLTKEPIEKQELLKISRTQKQVLSTAKSFEIIDKNTFRGLDENGRCIGYAITAESNGYGGKIKVMVGITPDAEICGVRILSHNETPGLGAKASDTTFTGMFLKQIPENGFTVTKSGANDGISAISGATVTSAAVTNAVNKAVSVYKEIEG